MLNPAPRRLRVEHPNPMALDDPAQSQAHGMAGMRWAALGDGLRAAVIDGQTEQDICMPSRAPAHLSLALMLQGSGHFAMGRESAGPRSEFLPGHAYLSWSAERFDGVDFIPAASRFRCVILQFRPVHRRVFDQHEPVPHSGITLCRHATARAWVARFALDALQCSITEDLISAGLPASPLDALRWECHALALLQQLADRLQTPCIDTEEVSETPAARLPARDRRALLAALRHIEKCYAEPLRVDDLARVAGMGVHALQQGFKQLFGDSVHAAVVRRRVAEAARLLRESPLPVSEVAVNCGFSNASHLARHFKRVQGVPPAAWRAGAGT